MKKKPANYYVDQRLKAPKSFFEWCYCQMPTYVWSNKDTTITASNLPHTYVNEKRLFKNSKLTFFDGKRPFMIILSTSKRIEIQTYIIYSSFVDGKQVFDNKLLNLELLTNNQQIKITCDDSGEGYQYGKTAVTGMYTYYYPDVYPNNWAERLNTVSELKYIKLDSYDIDLLHHVYKYRESIEFLQKIKATQMAKELACKNSRLDMRTITKNWLRKHKQFFANSNHGFEELRLRDEIERLGGKMVPGIEKYLSLRDLSQIPVGIGIVKFQNYVIKQQLPFFYYRDYISMANELGVNLTKSRLLPKNLEAAHDELVRGINNLKREIEIKEIEQRAYDMAHAEMKINGYTFILPKSAKDLIDEGKALIHCVGGEGYIKKHAEGKTMIVFVRDQLKPDEPLYTMEFNGKRIVQLRGYDNTAAPDDALEAAKIWMHQVKDMREIKQAV